MINRVVLVGRLTRDVEVRKTGSNLSVATFTVACDRRFSNGQEGQQSADFISCVAWRQTADFLAQYAKKGTLVGVEGRIQTRNYKDKDGKTVYVTEVVADNVQLLSSKSSTSTSTSTSYNSALSTFTPSVEPDYSSNAMDDFSSAPSLDISSDDLPFY